MIGLLKFNRDWNQIEPKSRDYTHIKVASNFKSLLNFLKIWSMCHN